MEKTHSVQDMCKKWNSKYFQKKNQHVKNQDFYIPQPKSNQYTESQVSRVRWERNNRRRKASQFTLPKYHGIAQFKMAPTIFPVYNQRPYVGLCCAKCLPKSKIVKDPTSLNLSVCNVLHFPFIPSYFHLSSKLFHQTKIDCKTESKFSYPDVSTKVLQNEGLSKAIQAPAMSNGENHTADKMDPTDFLAKQMRSSQRILHNMKASLSILFMRFSGWCFHSALTAVLDGLIVHKGQIEILQTISKEDTPIIYMPLHHSYLDCALASFILYMNNLRVPLMATEDNLFIPIFGYLLQLLGAFFVCKGLNINRNKPVLYNTVLQSYVSECLKAGHNLEFFMDQNHHIDDQSQSSEAYLLSIIINSILEGSIDDVYISPIVISYEKYLEEDLCLDQLNHSKQNSSFISILSDIWRIFHSNFGYVRVNFGQPFSLKEFLHSSKQSLAFMKVNFYESDISDHIYKDNHIQDNVQSLIKDLTSHLIYDASLSTSLMSTHLIAFLLLTHFRKGATQQQLLCSLDSLRKELKNKKIDVGFTGESSAVIKRAVAFFGANLITSECVEMEWTSSDLENNNVKVTVYKPTTVLPHVLELQYYANSVVPVFLLESIVVNAIYATVHVEICRFALLDSRFYIGKDDLMDKCEELCEILKFEFVMTPPCSDLVVCIHDIIDSLMEKECLTAVGVNLEGRPNKWQGRPHILSFESSDEDEPPPIKQQQLKIMLTEESVSHLEHFRGILSPFIESYWLAASALLSLVQDIREGKHPFISCAFECH